MVCGSLATVGATPRHLIRMGVYQKIALPMQGGPLRPTSLALVAEVLSRAPPPTSRTGGLFSGVRHIFGRGGFSGGDHLAAAKKKEGKADQALLRSLGMTSTITDWANITSQRKSMRTTDFSQEGSAHRQLLERAAPRRRHAPLKRGLGGLFDVLGLRVCLEQSTTR
jgi:hypothetical protein